MRRPLAALLLALGIVGAGALAAAPAAPVRAQAPGCEVAGGTLHWGVKESFRAYIDGSIANGEWTVADGATYDTPLFSFPAGPGRIDPRDPNGSVAFGGSVRFTGHGGILDTTIANPVLVVRGDGTGLLLLDVHGPTMDGGSVDVRETPFVAIDLAGQDLTPVAGLVTIDAAPATLTAEGAEAFPNYPEGEEFDPVSATLDVGDCDLTGQPIGSDVIDDPAGDGVVEEGVIGNATPWIALIAGLGIALVTALVLLLTGRRR